MAISDALKNPAIKVIQIEKQSGIYPGTIRNGKYPKEKEPELIRVIGNLICELSQNIDFKTKSEPEIKSIKLIPLNQKEYVIKNNHLGIIENGLFRRIDFPDGTIFIEKPKFL